MRRAEPPAEKLVLKPGNMLYPVPAVLVTCRRGAEDNILTISWTGTVCTNPPMLSISVRPERHSYPMLRETGVFAVNLPTRALARAVDFCGVTSGRDIDKFETLRLTKVPASAIDAPLVRECPVSIECRVRQVIELGSHHLFLASVEAVAVDRSLMDAKGKLRLEHADLLCYNHGSYCVASRPFGKFGFSVEKKKAKRPARNRTR